MILRIYHSSRRKAVCRTCGHPMEFARLVESGKFHPFHGEVKVADTTCDHEGRTIDLVDTETSPSHFQFCKQAKQWRSRR